LSDSDRREIVKKGKEKSERRKAVEVASIRERVGSCRPTKGME
jgi:hypothetical protein